MLKWKPMLTKCVDSSGRTPLHYAASDGHSDTVKLLLEHDPSTAFLSDADGLFPIHIAARMGNVSTVDKILQQCPKTSELLEMEGKNFLHVAFKNKRLDEVKKIISKRPDLKKLLNDRDNEGNTPLHTAVENNDGFTPLDLACAKLDAEPHFLLNADDYIAACLALTKAGFGPRQFHASKRIELSSNKVKRKSSSATKKKNKEKSSSYVNKEMEKDHKISQNFVVVSVLVATVTFAAAFTVPGGYIADDHPGRGTAVLAKDRAFNWFLASDFFAFVSSTTATFLFAFTEAVVVDKHFRRLGLSLAVGALFVAIGGMFCAFVSGIVASLPPASIILDIFHYFIIFWCIILIFVSAIMVRQRSVIHGFHLLKPVRQREGVRQLLFPTMQPSVRQRLPFHAIHAPFFVYLYLVLIVVGILGLVALL